MKVKSSFGPNYNEFEVGNIAYVAKDKPLKLENGSEIQDFPIAYQTYGTLNKEKSNAILICHALTGDQYAASKNPVTGKEGWWDFMIGKGKPIDTDKFFVIATNTIGSCMGSVGPKTINPKTNKLYGLDFPIITVSDTVKAQNLLIEEFFKINKLHAVIGGSAGGMQCLYWSILFPQKINLVVPISTSYRYSPQNVGFHEIARRAIMSDPNWCKGKYYEEGKYPSNGLALARMTAHITYLSEDALYRKFGRNLQDSKSISFTFAQEFEIESYLNYQGYKFVERFDPNSYLYVTKTIDYFDLETDFKGNLNNAFKEAAKNNIKFCTIALADDWHFPPKESRKLTKALISCGIDASFVVINSDAGHDSFLIENEDLKQIVKGFINQ